MYLPKRLELSFRIVFAFPNAICLQKSHKNIFTELFHIVAGGTMYHAYDSQKHCKQKLSYNQNDGETQYPPFSHHSPYFSLPSLQFCLPNPSLFAIPFLPSPRSISPQIQLQHFATWLQLLLSIVLATLLNGARSSFKHFPVHMPCFSHKAGHLTVELVSVIIQALHATNNELSSTSSLFAPITSQVMQLSIIFISLNNTVSHEFHMFLIGFLSVPPMEHGQLDDKNEVENLP